MKVKKALYEDKWTGLPETVKDGSLVLVFGNNEEAINELISKYPNAKFCGASSSGEIWEDQVKENSVVATIMEFSDKVWVDVQDISCPTYEDSFNAGQKLFEKINKDKLSGALVFCEGLKINGAKLAEGIAKLNTKNVPIIGGMAGDNLEFKETWVVNNSGVVKDSAVVVGFYGEDLKMVLDSNAGVDPFGIERKITKSNQNVLLELDGKPALDVYESFLGSKSKDLPATGLHFPVEISNNFEQSEGLLRTPIAIGREEKSITFTGEIPEGQNLRLMRATKNDFVDAAEAVSENCVQGVPKDTIESNEYLSLLISCAARKMVLLNDVEEEVIPSLTQLKKVSDQTANQIGLYSYGEFVNLGDKCKLVNQTMSQVIIYENKEKEAA